jgi:hypothetical protein
MSTAILSLPTSPVSSRPVTVRAAASTVFLPKEHGSWSLALEPVVLGLLIAPSWAGGALVGAALAGFFARRPFKASFAAGDPLRQRDAREAVVMWGALVLAGGFEAGVLGGWEALWPLAPAAMLGLCFAHWDGQGEGRSAAAELAGSAAFAFVPAAIATLAGESPAVALTLAVLVLARSASAVVTVRHYLRTAKGGAASPFWPLFVSGAAAAALLGLAITGAAPRIVAVFGALFFARTLWLASPWRPAWPARRIGQAEALLGLAYSLTTAASF